MSPGRPFGAGRAARRRPQAALEAARLRMGPGLARLAERQGSPLVSIRALTTLPSARLSRGSHRLEFEDGQVRKGRCAGSLEIAERVEAILSAPSFPAFPRVVGRAWDALLLEWVDGTVLTDRVGDADEEARYAHRCGELLGRLHAIRPDASLRQRYGCGLAGWHARLARSLDALVSLGALEPAESRRAHAMAAFAAPARLRPRVIHGDFCPENIVVTPDDRLYVIDNETIDVGPPAHDLARTWYRWSLGDPDRVAIADGFLDGYRQTCDPATFFEHRGFWTVVALAEAAVFRLDADVQGAEVPLDALRTFLHSEGRTRGAS